jgi:hypothetical protein
VAVPEQLSATVLLRPAGGGSVADVARSETAAQTLPDPEAAERAQAYFREEGFEIAAPFGPSFSIVGSRELFERTFGTKLEADELQGVRTAEGNLELPLEPLPSNLTQTLEAVTFTAPPDFGPTDYS